MKRILCMVHRWMFPPLAFRYVMRQLVPPFFMILLALYVLRVLLHVADNFEMVLGPRSGTWLLVKYYALQFAEFGQPVAPIALLAAMLWTASRSAKNGELIALQAGGLSPWQIARPMFFLSVTVCIALQALGLELAPLARREWLGIESKMRGRSVDRRVYQSVSTALNRDRSVWYVRSLNLDISQAIEPEVLIRHPNGVDDVKIFARRAEYDRQAGVWEFFKAVEFTYTPGLAPRVEAFPRLRMPLLTDSPEALVRWQQDPGQLRWHGLCGLLREAREGATWQATAPFRTEWHYRLAAPMLCLVLYALVLGRIDNPAVLARARRGAWLGLLQALVLMLMMQTWMEFSRALGNRGVLPPAIAAWNGILIFGAWALIQPRIRQLRARFSSAIGVKIPA